MSAFCSGRIAVFFSARLWRWAKVPELIGFHIGR
jgi:hypothetical protein